MEENFKSTDIQQPPVVYPFRLYQVISGNLKSPETLQIKYLESFISAGKAAQYLRSKEFLGKFGTNQETGEFLVISEHQHFIVSPITVYIVNPLVQKKKNEPQNIL